MSTSLRAESGPYFGDFGGRYVPESLIHALDELENGLSQREGGSRFS